MLRMLRIRTVARAPEAPKGFRPLLPLVCHPGGKSKSRGLIYRRMPAHDRYVEPFAGGASIFWGKPPSPKGDVLSDADRPLMGFYRRLNCAQLQRCMRQFLSRGKEASKLRGPWERRAAKLAAGSTDTCDVFIGKTFGYGCKSSKPTFAPGTTGRVAGKAGGNGKVTRCELYKDRLKKTVLLDGDYQGVMRRYDNPNTFFYLDPPWLGVKGDQKSNRTMYREDRTSPETVCAFLRKIKGTFILHYDDNPRIRRACKGFRIERVPWNQTMQCAGSVKRHALLISNFKLKAKGKP